MNNTINEQYNLVFQNRTADFGAFGKQIFKTVNTNSVSLEEFLNAWDNAVDIINLLILDINDVLNGVATLRENGSETISIDIEPDVVTFYVEGEGLNYPKIPTTDFLQIVTAWRDFLEQTPLNGTKR